MLLNLGDAVQDHKRKHLGQKKHGVKQNQDDNVVGTVTYKCFIHVS